MVGAGHAGCEAALASARLGCKTMLLTLNLDRIAWQVQSQAMMQDHALHTLSPLACRVCLTTGLWWRLFSMILEAAVRGDAAFCLDSVCSHATRQSAALPSRNWFTRWMLLGGRWAAWQTAVMCRSVSSIAARSACTPVRYLPYSHSKSYDSSALRQGYVVLQSTSTQ